MLQTIKKRRRRAYQDILLRVFKAEETTFDKNFLDLTVRFRLFEQEVSESIRSVKNLRRVSIQFFKSSYNFLSQAAGGYFDREDENEFFIYSAAYEAYVLNEILQPLINLTSKIFPSIKRKIQEHNGVKIDLESYRRRVKKAQANGKDALDAEVEKLMKKLEATQKTYDAIHSEVLKELAEQLSKKEQVLKPVAQKFKIVQSIMIEYVKNNFLKLPASETYPENKLKETFQDICKRFRQNKLPMKKSQTSRASVSRLFRFHDSFSLPKTFKKKHKFSTYETTKVPRSFCEAEKDEPQGPQRFSEPTKTQTELEIQGLDIQSEVDPVRYSDFGTYSKNKGLAELEEAAKDLSDYFDEMSTSQRDCQQNSSELTYNSSIEKNNLGLH
eukprot:maker-scaffold_7-snap-gene-8.63-mRNA-1 protein AED:0.01 eAED:0.01 QI:78/1/1/1/1/1/4/138/384